MSYKGRKSKYYISSKEKVSKSDLERLKVELIN